MRIAAAAGVSRGALYHHFPDKRALFETVFEDIERQLDTTVAEAALACGTAHDAVRTGARACLEFMQRPDYRRIAVIDGQAVLIKGPTDVAAK